MFSVPKFFNLDEMTLTQWMNILIFKSFIQNVQQIIPYIISMFLRVQVNGSNVHIPVTV